METPQIFAKFAAARKLLTSKYNLDLPSIFAIRRELHKYPEVRFTEVETKKRLLQYLSTRCKIDLSKVKPYAKTGFTYDIKGKAAPRGSPFKIGFRSDMDALPIKEENKFDYVSVNSGVAHMCGHDGHMATLLGLATVVSDFQNYMPSNKAVKLVFQPGEEGGHGGRIMVKEGALDDVNEIYGLHSWSLPFGKFGIKKSGAMTSSMVRFRVDVHGKGTHGASPENGKDPITTICQITNCLHTILSRRIGRKEMAVCTIGEMHAGIAENVIPDFATMGGSIRTEKPEVEEEVKKQLEHIVKHTSEAFECKGEVKYIRITPAVINHKVQACALRDVVKDIMGEESLCEEGMNASEDFSFMTKKVPGAYMLMGHIMPGKAVVMNHNPHFDYNEELIAPSILAWTKLIESRMGFKFA